MPEPILYSERQVFPWRLSGAFLLGIVAVCALVLAISAASFAHDWWLFAVGVGCVAVWTAWFWIAMRLSPVRLDASALRLPWPRIRRELESGWRGLRNPPSLKGLVATSANRAAVYLETDPSIGPPHRWLVGTRNPRELLACLEAAVAATKARSSDVSELPSPR